MHLTALQSDSKAKFRAVRLVIVVLLHNLVAHLSHSAGTYMGASKYTVYRRNKRSLHCCCCCFCHCCCIALGTSIFGHTQICWFTIVSWLLAVSLVLIEVLDPSYWCPQNRQCVACCLFVCCFRGCL